MKVQNKLPDNSALFMQKEIWIFLGNWKECNEERNKKSCIAAIQTIVFCKPADQLICFCKLYTNRKPAGGMGKHGHGVTIYFWVFLVISSIVVLQTLQVLQHF